MTVTSSDRDAETRHRELIRHMADGGHLADPAWRDVFTRVRRHWFLRDTTIYDASFDQVRSDDSRWLDLVYADTAVTTQLTDRFPTSSSTGPSLMADMLHALDVDEGHRVLEIATGTGYNAALLCERVGEQHVTTVEVDPQVAASARLRLADVGYHPTVVAADGAGGYLPGAPYDRLIATCAFPRAPAEWLAQVRTGGVIVCPIGYGTVRLDVGTSRAEGAFLPAASYFMPTRQAGETGMPACCGSRHDGARTTSHRLDLAIVVHDPSFRFALSLRLPSLGFAHQADDDGTVAMVEMWAADNSWARADHDGQVQQAGPRSLWDLTEHTYQQWNHAGRPETGRYRLTVQLTGEQHVHVASATGR